MKKYILVAAGLVLLPANASAKQVQYDLRVDGMTCPFCVATSEKALKKIAGVSHVSTNLKAGRISVCAAETISFTDQKLAKLFLKKGFTYKGKTKKNACTIADKSKK